MKTLLLILAMLVCIPVYSQVTIKYENGNAVIPIELWYAFVDSAVMAKLQSLSKDTIIYELEQVVDSYDKRVLHLETVVLNKDKEIANCNEQVKLMMPKKDDRLFIWDGFYLGYKAGYVFQDSVITQETFISGIRHNLYCEAHIKINRFRIQTGLNLPLSSSPVGIYGQIGYSPF